jgi:hypothetical protein
MFCLFAISVMLNDVRILCFLNFGLVHGIWPSSCLCLVFVLCLSPLGIEGRHHDIFLILYELLNSKGNQGSACINSYIYPTNMINIKRVIDIVRRNCESIKLLLQIYTSKYRQLTTLSVIACSLKIKALSMNQ